MQAREVVEFTLEFKGDPERIVALQHDLLNRGVPVTLNPGDVELDGSLLLKHAFEQSGPVTVQASKGFNAKILFRPVGPDGTFIGHLEAPAVVEGGLTEMRLHAELPNAPFGVDIQFEVADGKPSQFVNFSVLFALSRWVGKPIQHLPYFQDILAMFKAVAAGNDVRVDCLWEGNPIFGGRVANDELKGWLKVLPFLQTYEKAREMARHLKVNPPLPEKMTIDELVEIEDLHWRVWPGQHRVPGEGMEFNVHLIKPDLEALFKQSSGPLILKTPDEPVKFLRQTVSTGPVEYELTCPRIKQSIEELRASASDGGVSATFVGTEQSEVIVRRPPTPSTERMSQPRRARQSGPTPQATAVRRIPPASDEQDTDRVHGTLKSRTPHNASYWDS